MIVLGIETSTIASSVSLCERDERIAGMTLARGRSHVEFLMPAILSMSKTANVPLDRLTGIAVGIGPGLFTGMRVGIATAKTLAQTLQIPIMGISSLDLLAFSVRHTAKVVCACVDARRGEVFAAFYEPASGGIVRLSDYAAWEPKALAAEVLARDEHVLFVGNGALAYGSELGRVGEVAGVGTQYPRAEALCELAAPRFEREETTPVAQLEPLYVRRSDAEINWERRGVAILRPDRVRIPKRAMER